ncbi:hypothetical protein [Nocardia jiangxiensis]|uniref:hypothetical protein n=1 Tax=Nocardia jiangxiensis TaxID=282685 RepID=UPI0012F6BCD1|nr:hypothetical protein [Nocardia jiangxiensis]
MTNQELLKLLYDCWNAGAHRGHPGVTGAPEFAEWLRQQEISTEGVSKYLTCEGYRCCRSMISGLCMDAHCPHCDAIAGSLMTRTHLENCPGRPDVFPVQITADAPDV